MNNLKQGKSFIKIDGVKYYNYNYAQKMGYKIDMNSSVHIGSTKYFKAL